MTQTPAPPDLSAKLDGLLISLGTERAKLFQQVEELYRRHRRIVEGRNSLQSSLSGPRAAEHREVTRRLKTLSNRQRQVLDKIVAGMANKAIAFELGLSEKTVETHRSRLMRKLGAASLSDLVRMVLRGA